MQEDAVYQKIWQILKKSHGEPSKFMELIECISSMNREGEAASYPRIVRRLWPKEWEENENKVEFEQAKWDLLCKRRREINRRVLSSPMCLQFFIELSPDKKFKILTDAEQIHSKRQKELEWNLAREKSESNKENIQAEIIELKGKFHDWRIKQPQGITETPTDKETDLLQTEKTPGEVREERKRRLVLPLSVALVILAVGITLAYIFSLQSPSKLTSVRTPTLPLPDKPSVAVLPFVNLGEDKSQEFFSDGLTEGIITALAKTPKLFVIARNSSFVYKGKPVSVQQVGRELGVRYVLEGGVQKSGNHMRITAQLVDAKTGSHLWAERYDRELKDFFAIQDEVTVKIMASVTGMTVPLSERMSLVVKGASNLDAYLKTMEVFSLPHATRDEIALARKTLEEAIALDPQWAVPYGMLSFNYTVDYRLAQDPEESLKKIYEYAQKALSLDETQLDAYMALVLAYAFQRRYDDAIAAGGQAVKVAPGSAHAHICLARSLLFTGKYQEALVYLERAVRMNPFPPWEYFLDMAGAHIFLRNHEEAVSALKKVLSIVPKHQYARLTLIVA